MSITIRGNLWSLTTMLVVTLVALPWWLGPHDLNDNRARWSHWSTFGDCSFSIRSASCVRTRTRVCINGSPGDQGCHVGEGVEQQPCSKAECHFYVFDTIVGIIAVLTAVALLYIYLLRFMEHWSREFQQMCDRRHNINKNKPRSIHDHQENTSVDSQWFRS